MEQRSSWGRWHFAALGLVLLAVGIAALLIMSRQGDQTATLVLGMVLGAVLMSVANLWNAVNNWIAASRAQQEFRDNAIENEKLLLAQQKAINEQIRGQSMASRGVQHENSELRKLLNVGQPAEVAQYGMLIDDAVYDELGDE